jgi:hypothetical protein
LSDKHGTKINCTRFIAAQVIAIVLADIIYRVQDAPPLLVFLFLFLATRAGPGARARLVLLANDGALSGRVKRAGSLAFDQVVSSQVVYP